MSDVNEGRRKLLRLSTYVAGATVIGSAIGRVIAEEAGKDLYAYLKGLVGGNNKYNKLPLGLEYLLGDNPKNTGILPPGTNRHLLAKGVMCPSRYVSKAFEVSTSIQKQILGFDNHIVVDHNDKRILADQDENLLVIGGPVATEFTRAICGYTDVQSKDNPRKPVPIIDPLFPLPYYFYVGNENGFGYWGDEYRSAIRWHEDGKEGSLPLYGIYDKERDILIPQPVTGKKVSGDMLMIIRVPNPENISGKITIIGGLHGYSLESFFSNIEENMEIFAKIVNSNKYDYFQALLPFNINQGQATLDIVGKGEWRTDIKEIDPKKFLAFFSINNV